MRVEASTQGPLDTGADTVAIGVFEDEGVAHDLPGAPLAALLERGEARRSYDHLALARHGEARVVLVGLGSRQAFDGERARGVAATVLKRSRELATSRLCWEIPHHVSDSVAAAFAEGTLLAAYRFDRRGTGRPGERDAAPETLILSAHHDLGDAARRAAILAGAQNRARELANQPPNELTPATLADHCERLAASQERIGVRILDGEAIRAAGMGAIAAVARGSAEDPRVIVLDYAGPGADGAAPLALIGKAVTFDSGGLWLKTGQAQREMKFDMAGGAAVVEAVGALARLEAPVRVSGVIGAAENMPGPAAMRPGEIVTALDGSTIQIDNTDAEGRLLLADCITLARRSGATRLIDIATLTGGIVAALGSAHAGLMSSDDTLAAVIEQAAHETGELVWRMPLHPRYAEMVKGRYADVVNLTERREAMAITAAEFLHHFAGPVPWAHLDIAGTAFNVRRPYLDTGASGFGVRLLVQAAIALGLEAQT